MRDARDLDRGLHARSGEWAHAPAGARSLSPGPFSAETGEREPGARLTETETRFTDGEKIQTRPRTNSALASPRLSSPSPLSLFNGEQRRGSDRSPIILTFSPDRALNRRRAHHEFAERTSLILRPASGGTPRSTRRPPATAWAAEDRGWRATDAPDRARRRR